MEEIERFISRYCDHLLSGQAGIAGISRHLADRQHAKGHLLVQEGQRHPYAYYLLQGAVRSFYLKDGVEVNTWFAFEGEMVGSFQNYLGQASRETLQLVEDSRLIAINLNALRPLQQTSLEVSNFVRLVIEEYTAFLEERLFHLQHHSSMERYLYLLDNDPQVFQRIPLTYIASYLGISRETLSRLRGRTIL